MKKGLILLLILSIVIISGCKSDPVTNRCQLAPEPGSCDDNIPKYYFDGTQCRDFSWGGCDGTIPFETREECQEICEEPPQEYQHIVYTTDASEDPLPYQFDCEDQGGIFNTCGSSCPPEAELCVQVCAYTCDVPLN